MSVKGEVGSCWISHPAHSPSLATQPHWELPWELAGRQPMERIYGEPLCVHELSRVQLCASLWTVARQAPLSMGSSRQEYWRGLPCPLPGDLPNPGIKLASPVSPALAGGFFTTEP